MRKSPENKSELLPSVEMAVIRPARSRYSIPWEVVRFAIVGVANTAIDLCVLNGLLILFPTHDAGLLVVYNSVSYSIGALNSFILNKYWTFHHNQTATKGELLRFALINLFSIFCNNSILWIAASTVHPPMDSAIVWANFSKVFAITGTATVSFLGMRLWVFTSKTRRRKIHSYVTPQK